MKGREREGGRERKRMCKLAFLGTSVRDLGQLTGRREGGRKGGREERKKETGAFIYFDSTL